MVSVTQFTLSTSLQQQQKYSIQTVMPLFWHILIFCITVLFSQAVSIPQNEHVCYALPRGTSNSSCPHDGNPCLDINTYVLSSSRYFISNTTFIFLPGIHFFDVEELFNIENVDMLFLIGNSSCTQSSVADDSVTYNFRQYNDDSIVTYLESLTNIKCSGKSGFSFSNVTNLQLINLTIINCGIYSSQTSLNASIHLANISSLMIEGVTIKNSTGYGLLGVNVLGHSSIIRSSFIGNNQFVKSIFRATNITNKCNNEQFNSTRYISNDLTSCSINGGNVYLKFEYSDPNRLGGNELLLSYIVLSLGVDGCYPYCSTPTPGTGLALVIHNHVHVTINNTVSYRNQGQFGANFYFETISGSNITIHNVTSKSGVSSNGSLYFYILSSSALQKNTSQLMIKNSTLACNYAEEYGGSIHISIPEDSVHFIYMYIYLQNSTIVDDISSNKPNTFLFIKTGIENIYISVSNCYFKNFNSNSGLYKRFEIVGKSNDLIHVHVQLLMDSSYFMYTELSCELVDVYITNSNFNYSRATAIRSSIILNEKVFFSNVLTRIGGALLLVSSLLVIKEHAVVIFANNIATNGGALFIDQQSSVLFFSSSNVSFINNVATLAGGAIYVQSGIPSPFIRSKCFFQFNVTYGLEFDVHIYFEGNYAGDAGSVLYGGNIDHCTLDCSRVPHQYHNICIKSSGKIFNMTMDIGPHDNTMSLISSDPTTVCYCNQGYPLTCSHPDHKNVMVYPGEKVNKSLITLGQRSGITPGIVYAWYISLDLKNVSIASTFRTSSRCEGYDISIKNLNINNTIILYLTTQESFNSATDIMHKIEFGITILPCPIGFSIENTTSLSCDCNALLHSHGLTCNISTQYFSWSSGAKWIGNISHNVIGIIDDCPSNYCNSLTTVTLQNSDKQCKYNCSGILCGQCKDNLSMMFGSSQCGSECKNHHLLLLIPFAIMGVALVGFLLVFNFTVTNGTINSFILYAFITGLNENIYLPSSCYKFLFTFIFWLNIDLGIETCFYEYMDSIGKVWLQFLIFNICVRNYRSYHNGWKDIIQDLQAVSVSHCSSYCNTYFTFLFQNA